MKIELSQIITHTPTHTHTIAPVVSARIEFCAGPDIRVAVVAVAPAPRVAAQAAFGAERVVVVIAQLWQQQIYVVVFCGFFVFKKMTKNKISQTEPQRFRRLRTGK